MMTNINFISVLDLVFNNGADCIILESRPVKGEYVTIFKEYDWARDCDAYEYYYKNIHLGTSFECITIGDLDRIAAAIRGRGHWLYTSFSVKGLEHHYQTFTPEEARVIKKAGVWAF